MKKDDIVTAAIAKAQQELAMPEHEKIAVNIKSLYERLTRAYEKLTEAKAETKDKNSTEVDVFQQSVDKLKYEIYRNRKALKRIKADMAMANSKHHKLDDLTIDNHDYDSSKSSKP